MRLYRIPVVRIALVHFTSDEVKVHSREIRDVEELRASITSAIAYCDYGNATADTARTDYRLDILRATEGAHVEVH
ncbi:hypothetical protein AVEN_189703-1 [Araneus ventricosus]|uniref:Uncharacterized protein n=1 Tax=Araneus ventricosus TaxID=182803 RepID=A0A4Y2PVS2_ARAVE|nr:hypothetical protein AVEN_189703-1 [Araneus ventricosus]